MDRELSYAARVGDPEGDSSSSDHEEEKDKFEVRVPNEIKAEQQKGGKLSPDRRRKKSFVNFADKGATAPSATKTYERKPSASMSSQQIHQPNRAALSWSKKEREYAQTAATSIAHLKILVATWNVGNEEPSSEFSPWIPPQGGDYDIIAIAVQESSFKSKNNKSNSGDETKEEEDDNLDQKDTGKRKRPTNWTKAKAKFSSVQTLGRTRASVGSLNRAGKLRSAGQIPSMYGMEENTPTRESSADDQSIGSDEETPTSDIANSEQSLQQTDQPPQKASSQQTLPQSESVSRQAPNSSKRQGTTVAMISRIGGRIASLPNNYKDFRNSVTSYFQSTHNKSEDREEETVDRQKKHHGWNLTAAGNSERANQYACIEGGPKSVGLSCGSICGADNKIFDMLLSFLNAEKQPLTLANIRSAALLQPLLQEQPHDESIETSITSHEDKNQTKQSKEDLTDIPHEDKNQTKQSKEDLTEGTDTIQTNSIGDLGNTSVIDESVKTPMTAHEEKQQTQHDLTKGTESIQANANGDSGNVSVISEKQVDLTEGEENRDIGDILDKEGCQVDYDTDESSLDDDHVDNSWTVVDHLMLGESLGLVVEIGLIVFARRKHVPAITRIQHDSQETGIMGLVANKGGVAISFNLYGTPFCFIGAHLAAHMHQVDRRNEDVEEILEKIRFGQSGVSIDNQFGHVFVAGDLNYRLDRTAVDAKTNKQLMDHFNIPATKWLVAEGLNGSTDSAIEKFRSEIVTSNVHLEKRKPPPRKSLREISKSVIKKREAKAQFVRRWLLTFSLIEVQQWSRLLHADQLKACQAQGLLLTEFQEGTYNFPPTFKVNRQAGFRYKSKRIPSYCDRVLWKSLPGLASHVHCEYVSSYESIVTSDHKPVAASFFLSISAPPKLENVPDCSKCPVIIFTKLSGSGLLAADSNGLSDPYVYFLGDPPGLIRPPGADDTTPETSVPSCSASVLEEEILKTSAEKMLLHVNDTLQRHQFNPLTSYPRTNVRTGTLNPVWNCKTEVPILRVNCPDPLQLSRSHLFLHVMDYDANTKDDFLGTAVLSLSSVAFGDQGCQFEVPVTYNGRAEGRLTGTCEVVWPHDPRFVNLKETDVFFPPKHCDCTGGNNPCCMQ